jgi:hypothetical protein
MPTVEVLNEDQRLRFVNHFVASSAVYYKYLFSKNTLPMLQAIRKRRVDDRGIKVSKITISTQMRMI